MPDAGARPADEPLSLGGQRVERRAAIPASHSSSSSPTQSSPGHVALAPSPSPAIAASSLTWPRLEPEPARILHVEPRAGMGVVVVAPDVEHERGELGAAARTGTGCRRSSRRDVPGRRDRRAAGRLAGARRRRAGARARRRPRSAHARHTPRGRRSRLPAPSAAPAALAADADLVDRPVVVDEMLSSTAAPVALTTASAILSNRVSSTWRLAGRCGSRTTTRSACEPHANAARSKRGSRSESWLRHQAAISSTSAEIWAARSALRSAPSDAIA